MASDKGLGLGLGWVVLGAEMQGNDNFRYNDYLWTALFTIAGTGRQRVVVVGGGGVPKGATDVPTKGWGEPR